MNNAEQLATLMPEGIDGALVTSSHNRRYLSKFSSSSGMILVTRDKSYFLTDSRYIQAARERVKGIECIEVSDFFETLNQLIKTHNIETLIVEDDGLSCSQLIDFRQKSENVEFQQGILDEIVNRMRLIKSPYELECICQAQVLTDEGFKYILNFISEGRTEREVALELEFFIRRSGAEGMAFDTIVVSGDNSSKPHGVPSDKILKRGDFVTMDFGAKIDGWHSDMTRTIAVKEYSDKQKEVYDTVLLAQTNALEFLKDRVLCKDVDSAARDIIVDAGYGDYFGHSTGHGVGVQIHEQPTLSQLAGETVLKAGSVVTVEPGIYLPGEFGVRIEDMAFVTEEGSKNLTRSTKELIVV